MIDRERNSVGKLSNLTLQHKWTKSPATVGATTL
jgi:hypothetical protein